jgi:hypothetical protein
MNKRKSFIEIKRTLTNNPALGLPDVMKSFFLYVHERLWTAVGVLTQLVGSWHCLMAYLSKQLDAVYQGWLSCLCALVATAILVANADKFTLGQELMVHSVLKYGQEILKLLKAIWVPKQVVVSTAKGTRRRRQHLSGETTKLIENPN